MEGGPLLRRLRRQKGLSQAQLAHRVGVRQALISELETGQPPRARRQVEPLRKLAGFFGITLDELLKGELQQDQQRFPHARRLWKTVHA